MAKKRSTEQNQVSAGLPYAELPIFNDAGKKKVQLTSLEKKVVKILQKNKLDKLNPAQKKVLLERLRTPYIRLSEPYEPGELKSLSKVKFGVISDTHINSQYSDWGILSTIYDKFEQEKVQAVFHCGNLTAGETVYPGQSDDLRCFGWEETIKIVKKEYPEIKDVKTYFITGKHDSNYTKKINGEIDIGREINNVRPDLVYISMQGGGCKLWVGDIKVGKNTLIKLVHPNMAAPYAISYPAQKIVDSIEGGKKPQILLFGGFQKYDWIIYRDIEVIQAGTIQHQTPYMLSKKWFGSLVGLIVDAELQENGALVKRLTVSEIPFYE